MTPPVSRYKQPSSTMLETFDNESEKEHEVTIHTETFTFISCKDNLPYFGSLLIEYGPSRHCLYQETFGTYMNAYRNESGTPENIVARVYADLMEVLVPVWLHVAGGFNSKGGLECSINIDSRYTTEDAREDD